MNDIEINPQFEQVLNFVNHTNRPVFLTGKAGTGKTTLLKYIKQNTFKQIAIVAPTGVAAINAGGTTIHSFFQFPFAPFLPVLNQTNNIDYSKNNLPALKYNSQRLAIFRNLELLVIDEISMVRADLLDQIDVTLRQTRKKWQQPFGGVQVLLIGDMHQLPPVVQSEEWNLLNKVYQSPYFFESLVIKNNPAVYIELNKIYRQNEQTFIDLLNKVRNNVLDEQSLNLLNQQFRDSITQNDYQENITLTTHNRKADEINTRNLDALPGKAYKFKCRCEGVFSDKNFPADEELVLKKGTRVMFLKNNNEKNYYNGKIGVVSFVDDDVIKVKCNEDKFEIEVIPETWSNVAYSVNKATKHLEEDVLGTFIQYPLRLAWAITIHKSQGLTFDKLIIDAAESFSAGQVYVALSRCRSLNGLTFSSKISARSLMNDNNILNFSATRQNENEINTIYTNSRRAYMGNLLLSLFDFSEVLSNRTEVGGIIHINKTKINADGVTWEDAFFKDLESLNEVAQKFRNQLGGLLNSATDLETDKVLNERIAKASAYFEPELIKLNQQLKNCTLFTESKIIADELSPLLQQLFEQLFTKQQLLKSCFAGFNFNAFIKQKLGIVYPDFKVSVYASAKNSKVSADVKYPALFRKLLLIRDRICNEDHKPIYLVANNKSLTELVNYLPTNEQELMQISGFGQAKAQEYGEDFLKEIRTFMSEEQLESNMIAMPAKKGKKKKTKEVLTEQDYGTDDLAHEKTITKKVNTREQTFALFKQGLTLAEIAKQRGFAQTTVEGHLVPYVAEGIISIDTLVNKEKQEMIKLALEKFEPALGLNPVKNALPEHITYSEIKYVVATIKKES
ncbi:MAG: helix-turn-helix domain-containing protein [Bacteroidia bacterium]|nr:helix-turn-helix domain-containing protein [Bacteroidia bacterium]